MKKRLILLFLALACFALLSYGCNDKKPEGEQPSETVETTEWYVSLSGDVLMLSGDVFSLTYASSDTVSGKYKRQDDLLILYSESGDLYISLGSEKKFSFVDMGEKKDIEPVLPQLCAHENKELRSSVEPTCDKEGYSGDLYCVDCGAVLQAGAVMPPKGHNFTVESDEVCQEGFCTRNQTNYYKCSVCGAIGDKTYEVPNTATGEHHFTAVGRTVYAEATCAKNQVNYAACSVCGKESTILTVEVENTATGRHDFSKPSTKKLYQEADCGHNAIYYYECSVCGMPSLDPADTYEVEGTKTGMHDYSQPSGIVKTEATCVQNRIEYAACSVCGTVDMRYEAEIPNTATGRHLYTALSDIEVSKATCTRDRTVYSKCAYCGQINRSRVLNVQATATGHTYSNYICTDCGIISDSYESSRLYDVSFDKNVDDIKSYFFVGEGSYDMVLYGKGSMEGYSSATGAPWAAIAENIQNVYVAGKIDKIGDYAFAGMTTLKNVKFLPVRVPAEPLDFSQNYSSYYTKTGNSYNVNASSTWDAEKQYYFLTDRSVLSIGNYAFYKCTALEKLSLPYSLQKLGVGALSYCEKLRKVNTPDLSDLTSVGENLFFRDIALTQINLSGTGLRKLSQGMFSECYSLSTVTFPSALEEIDAYCFFETAIPEIVLPSSIRSVGAYAFAGCTWTESVVFEGNDLISIGDGAFYGDTLLSQFTVQSGITSIGKNVLEGTCFYDRYANWTAGMLYLNVDSNKEYLLKGASEKTYLVVEPLETDNPSGRGWYKKEEKGYVLSTDTFCRGGKLYYEYYKDENEEKFLVVQTELSPGQQHWYEKDGGGNYVLSSDILCRGGKTYYEYWEADGSYMIVQTHPNNPAQMGWYEVEYELVLADEYGVNGSETYYQKIDAVSGEKTLPGATVLIADGAMENCIDLSGFTMSENTAYIGRDAFYYCYSLLDLDLQQAVVIGDGAFYGCAKLVGIKLPAQTERVGEYAFANCTSLRSFAWKGTTTVADTALSGDNLFEVFRPTSGDDAFGAQVIFTDQYDRYDSTSVIDSDGTFVYAKYNDQGYLLGCLKPESLSLSLPENFFVRGQQVSSYTVFKNAFSPLSSEDGSSVFYSQVRSVSIPASVVVIEEKAFYGCSYLSEISLPLNVSAGGNVELTVGNNVFGKTAYAMNDDNWENGLLYLASNADGNREGYILLRARSETGISIETTTVKEGTYIIADKAFYDGGCRYIKTLTLPTSILLIGENALSGCTGLTTLTTPFVGRTLPKTKTQENSFIAYLFGGTTYEENASFTPETLSSLTVSSENVVPDHSLDGCSLLKNISYSNAVNFGEYALNGCTQASFRIVKNILSADTAAFKNCRNLNKVSFATAIKEIGDYAFYGTGLKQVNLSEKDVQKIGAYAFAECAYLYELTLGEKIERIDGHAFENCIGLLSVSFDKMLPDGWCSDRTQSLLAEEQHVRVESCDCNAIGSVKNTEVTTEVLASHSAQMLDAVIDDFDALGANFGDLISTLVDTSNRTNGWRSAGSSDITRTFNFFFGSLQTLFGNSKDSLLEGISYTAQSCAIVSFTKKYVPVTDPVNTDLAFYYEYAGGLYTKTTDSAVVANKSYYTEVAGFIPQRKYTLVTDKNESDFAYYYEQSGRDYVRSITKENAAYDSTKTYYREMTYADYMAVIAGLFGYTSTSAFLTKANAVAAEYVSNNAGVSIVARDPNNPDNNGSRLKYNGAVYTDSGSFVLPFAFKNGNSTTSTVLACLIVDDSGSIYMWLSDADMAARSVNVNNVLGLSNTTARLTVHGRCMLFPWSGVIGEKAFIGCKKLVEISYPGKDILTGTGSSYGNIADNVVRVYNPGSASSVIRMKSNFLLAQLSGEYYLLSYIGDLSNETVISLPEEYLDGIKYYKIYPYAFAQNKQITGVRINGGVTEIGQCAFEGCTSLVSVTDFSAVSKIGIGAFMGSGLTGINIPSSVVTIQAQAFKDCVDLQTVGFGSQVARIEDEAFYGCISLRTIALPTSVRHIGDQAFAECTAAVDVTVQSVLETVGVGIFKNCYKLISLKWYSSSDFGIRSNAFENAGTGDDGINVTFYCTNVPNYMFYTGNTGTAPYVTSITFDTRYATKTIGTYAFYYMSVTSVILPSSLETISSFAFSKSSLRSLTLPENVISIGESAFEDCSDLTWITIPFGSRLNIISDRAFRNTAISTISLPSSVLSVGDNAFANCGDLQYVAFDVGIVEIHSGAFVGCATELEVYIVRKEDLNSQIDTIKSSFPEDARFTNVYFDDTVSYSIRTGSQGRISILNATNVESIDYLSANTNVLTVARDGTMQAQSIGDVTVTATITFRNGLQIRLSCTYSVHA